MRTPLVLLSTVAVLCSGCGIRGSGVAADELREPGPFEGVVNETSIDVEIEAREGAASSVRVECDDNLLEHIETRVEGDRLVVTQPPGSWVQPRVRCRVVVVADSIRDAEVAGSGDVLVWSDSAVTGLGALRVAGSGGLHLRGAALADELALSIAGSGDLVVDRVEARHVTATLGGSGSMVVSDGQSETVDVSIEGSGDVDLASMSALEVDAGVFGSGSAHVRCTDRIAARVDGSGDVVIYGDPLSRDERRDGSGSIVYR